EIFGLVGGGAALAEVAGFVASVLFAGACGGGLGVRPGRRCAMMSAARCEVPPAFSLVAAISVMISTSSRRLRSAAGLTRIFKKRSLPGDTSAMVPTGNPLGKM